ncbi:MAG TPA: hypothetical protein PKE17_19470 [Saprospiraceae bacterium]|nr:hypothetical protein [Saprospiraceae bacterium]
MNKYIIMLVATFALNALGEHPELKVLRESYSNQVNAAIRPVTDRYAKQLYHLQQELIRNGKLDDALAVRAERERIKAPEPKGMSDLRKSISGTTWAWHGNKNDLIRFLDNGTIEKPDWQKRGLETKWEVIDDNSVLLTVVKGRTTDLHATLMFNNKRNSFTGQDFHKDGKISESTIVK